MAAKDKTGFRFKGRNVLVGVVTFGDIMEANAIREKTGNNQDALWHVMAKAVVYDDGAQVFADIAAIMASPASEAGNLMRLSAETARLNMPDVTEGASPSS